MATVAGSGGVAAGTHGTKLWTPSNLKFNREQMMRFLVAHDFDQRQKIFEIWKEPLFHFTNNLKPRDEYRDITAKRVLRMLESGVCRARDLKENPLRFLALLEMTNYICSSFATKMGVQMSLFTGSIVNLGTEKHHKRFLDAVDRGEALGCFAMTELLHGSNVAGIQTTCEYRRETDDFILNTPNDGAQKYWIGNAACHGIYSTVFAKLIVDGEDKGVHAFVLQIRDPVTKHPLPGITVADCGSKIGLEGVDNGRFWFKSVKLPRDALLDRFAKIDNGKYVNLFGTPNKLFAATVGELVSGRVAIATGSLCTTQMCMLIAFRYASKRLQFGPPNKSEIPILDYSIHTINMMQILAKTISYRMTVNKLKEVYQQHVAKRGEDQELKRLVHVMSCGMKAVCSWHGLRAIQEFRELGGGHFYSVMSRMGVRQDMDIGTTYEGSNTVLLQQVASSLLKEFKDQFANGPVYGAAHYLNQRFTFALRDKNPVKSHMASEQELLDPTFWLHAFEYREFKMTRRVAKQLRTESKKMPFFDAWNKVLPQATELAIAYCDKLVVEESLGQINKAPSELRPVLYLNLAIFALSRLQENLGFFVVTRYLGRNKAEAIGPQLHALCYQLRTVALDLVECFGIPDHIVFSPHAFDYVAANRYEISKDGIQPMILTHPENTGRASMTATQKNV